RASELARLVLERSAGAGDLAVLDLELARLLLELLASRRELGVRALKLLEQLFRAHARADHVEDDAAPFRELVQEREVNRAERLEARELDNRLQLPLEHDREDADVARRGVAQTRAHLDVAVGHFGHEDALSLERALPDEALAELEPIREALPAL